MVGGAAVTQDWADQIGADGYAEEVTEAVKKARKFMS
jgi:5-methyltetrahydrofolate--homocysteine methyltransferase